MKIDFSAFHNCKCLQEIHFEKCINIVQTNIRPEDACSNVRFIIPNNLKNSWKNNEPFATQNRVMTSIELLQHKCNSVKNGVLIQSIIFLKKAFILLGNCKEAKLIDEIIRFIIQHFAITDEQINTVDAMIQSIENKKKQYGKQ